MQSGELAEDRLATAVSAYLASTARGELHYLHHLAAFYADVHPHHRAALAWARQDVALRCNGATLSLLAWCLHRAGRTDEALATVGEAFALGSGDPLLQTGHARSGSPQPGAGMTAPAGDRL